jgi:hypothetical protein
VHLRSLPDTANDGMAPFITYVEVEFPGVYNLEMHNWNGVLAIPEPANSIVSTKYFRVWAQTIAAGHLRDPVTADQAATTASRLADATHKEGSPIGAEIAVTQATIKAWQSFAHKRDDQAFQQISAAANMQDRVGQVEVDIPAREMYADMLLADDRPAEALVQYRTSLNLSPNRFNSLYDARRAAEAATARHPQTLLATYFNGRPLTVDHGAPLRLLVPVKLGLKNVKAITGIRYSAEPPRDYWAERGYSYYDGI